MRQAYAKIANARFALVRRPSTYPDATFTLRLAFGPVKGYEENGKQVPALDHDRRRLSARAAEHGNMPPFDLPQALARAQGQARTSTRRFNFVCTADIIGGNSGSPVVNRAGELVGIIFDGNIQSLVLGLRLHRRARPAPSPSTRSAILEALRKVYDAGAAGRRADQGLAQSSASPLVGEGGQRSTRSVGR